MDNHGIVRAARSDLLSTREAPPASGGWKFEKSNNTLLFTDARGKEWYEVDLDRCGDARATLDWIVQVAKKITDPGTAPSWVTPEVVGLLVIALDRHLRLQESQCGGAMR
jgi:hypothetical protein